MKIIDLLTQDRPTLSFEVFPPKTSDTYDSVAKATQEIAALRPDFMSVTYGAGGGTSDYTVNIAAGISQTYGVDVLRLIDVFRSFGLYVSSVVMTRFQGQAVALAFQERLEALGVKVYRHYPIEGYPSNISQTRFSPTLRHTAKLPPPWWIHTKFQMTDLSIRCICRKV